MNDDATLLRRYAEEGSDTAFTELVRRHVDLVYRAALRRTNGDTHRAADVAQQVFTTLAREARQLSRHAVLGAWLHTATRNAALNLILNNLRQLAAALDQFHLENGRSAASLDEIVGDTKYIRRLNSVDGENYAVNSLVAGSVLTVTDSEGLTITHDPRAPKPPPAPRTPEQMRADELGRRLQPALIKSVEAYRAANNGNQPRTAEALIPYFATPQEGADYVEFLEVQKGAGRK